ncbi:MAG: extracellular solute-binding protein [Pseudomonadota bacterium]|jgi:microcin C transport system substrate-binding protein|nr:extracellular solute-binding protein [Alphaproteobacteria bacterium]
MLRLSFIALAAFCFSLAAEKNHAMARFGAPLYSKDFSYFPYVNPNAPKGGTLRLGTIGTFDTSNPHAIKGTKAEAGLMLCLDPLMMRNSEEPFTLYGLVAEYVDVAADNSQITYYLNPHAKFHDGTPITAEDVKFTYEYLRDQGNPAYKHYYSKIEKIEIIDTLTIRLTLKKEEDGRYNSELPFNLSLLRPLPKHALEGKELASVNFQECPCSGPYKIGEVDLGHSITYEKVPNYWAENLNLTKGMNNFDKIRIDYYKTTQAQFQAFTAGEFDVFFETNPSNWETGYDFPAIKEGRVKKVDLSHERPVAVRTILLNLKKPIFADWQVRKALALAFDFDTLNKMIFSGSMCPVDSLFANTSLAHKGAAESEELNILEAFKDKVPAELYEPMVKTGFMPARTKGDGDQRENLDQAGKLLDSAGWIIKDGMRVNKAGEKLKIEIMYKDLKLEKIVLAFKESLRKLGVELIVRVMDNAQYENRVTDRDFDMIIHTWANGTSAGNEQMLYFSQKSAEVSGSSNYNGLKDPIAEQLALNVTEAKTPEELAPRVHALDRYIMCMYYQIPLFYDNKNRFAYWVDKLAFPEVHPKIGTNVMAYAWQPEGVQSAATEEKPGFFAKLKKFFQSLAG